MPKTKSWEVSDAFWEKVEPLIPVSSRQADKEYLRQPGGGRKPLARRKVFEGIVFVLRTGCQWKALPKEKFGCPSAVHRYFLKWSSAGVFLELWRRGLAEYDEMEQIEWKWQSIDGAMTKAPLAREAVGANPTDRGKKREQAPHSGGRAWRPSVARRDRGQRARRDAT